MRYIVTAGRADSLLIAAYGPFATKERTLSFMEAMPSWFDAITYHELNEPPADSVDGRIVGNEFALVGLSEAAGILGVSRQRVSQLAKKKDFPPVVVKLAATPVWRAEEVAQYGSHRFDPS